MSDNQLAIAQAPMFGLSTLEEAVNFAGQMAKANLLPAHLKGSPADCLRVVMQAARWQMDPFSVADKTSVISGKLMYEGQLVSAVVNARGNLSKRLDYKFEGEGDKRVLTVSGTLKGEQEPREITLDVIMAKRINKNGQMNQNPDQQMCYIGARMWARRHTSELMLGVYTPDEIDPDQPEGEQPNVTPVAERPAPKERAKRGAAGAKAAEVVVTQEEQKQAEPATPAPVENIQQAMEARQAKTQSQGGDSNAHDARRTTVEVAPQVPSDPAPAATPRVFLKDKEIIDVVCKIESFTAAMANPTTPFIKANLSGDFTGEARDKTHVKIGADKKSAVADPIWAVGSTVNVKLRGALNAAEKTPSGAPNPNFGKVLVWVDAISAVDQEEAME